MRILSITTDEGTFTVDKHFIDAVGNKRTLRAIDPDEFNGITLTATTGMWYALKDCSPVAEEPPNRGITIMCAGDVSDTFLNMLHDSFPKHSLVIVGPKDSNTQHEVIIEAFRKNAPQFNPANIDLNAFEHRDHGKQNPNDTYNKEQQRLRRNQKNFKR